MAQRPDCSTSYDSLVGSCNTLLRITIYKYLLLNPRKSFVSTGRSPIVLYYNNQGLELGMDIRSERLLVLKHNPCSDHVRAPKTTRMTIVRIKYSSVYREINISPHKNINSVMKFFETYEFSPQLTTRSSRKPISSPRRHNRTQTVCDLACRKGLDVLDLPPDIQPHSRRSTSRTIIVSKIVHGKTLHKFGASLKSLLAKVVKLFSRLLSFCQLLRWELLVGVECIFHIIGIAHDKSSWLLDDVLQSFMKAHGPLKISTIGNWSVLLQCQMTFCAAIVPNTKRISVKLSKANTIQLFFFVCVLYIKRTRFSGEIELRYSSAKP
ncbi:hypothetical protein YC2023_109714 [Brassica napus]